MEFCVSVEFTIVAADEAAARSRMHDLLADTGAVYDIQTVEREA